MAQNTFSTGSWGDGPAKEIGAAVCSGISGRVIYLVCAFFYLMALIVYLRRTGLNPVPPPPLPGTGPIINLGLPEGPKGLFALSMVLFVLALCSHVIAATFPLVVLIMLWWERGKVKREDIIPLIPFAVLGTFSQQAWASCP